MGRYDFDVIHDRRNTDCIKWDFGMEQKGRDDLLPLWVADMDFRLPEEVLAEVTERVRHGIFGYTNIGEDYRNIVRDWFRRRHGFTMEGTDIVVTPGVVYAIGVAIRAFTEPGDAVLVQQPVYYPFMQMIKKNGRKVVNNQLLYRDGRFEIDFADFEKKIIENNVKLFLLCSPHNPVGRVWAREELMRLAEICQRHDVYVFSDEIHADFVYPGYRHTSFFTLGETYRKKLILGTSPSKTFNMAGLQLSNIIIPDPDTRLAFRKENSVTGYSLPNVIGMTAAMAAYRNGEPWLEELLEYLQGNLSYLRDFLRDNLPQIKLIEPEGTYLVWLDFSKVADNHKELETLLMDRAKLWLDPGIIFGRETNLFERINIACPRSILEEAMRRLYEAIDDITIALS
uniref:MalY/PatB family protein n=1 Tax=Eubacterium cellulosolvens TaxID=29322 RepID=UPI000488587C|nr:MalY/PatB family protein [[Eubacterium] cellulosolvens]